MPKARATKNSSARLEEDDPPPPEPEGDGADGFSTPGVNAGEDAATVAAASAKRLAAASAVAGELAKARVSVGSFKSSLGKVQSPELEQIADWSSGLHTLAQSTDGADLAVVGEIIRTLGVDAPIGTSVDVAVEVSGRRRSERRTKRMCCVGELGIVLVLSPREMHLAFPFRRFDTWVVLLSVPRCPSRSTSTRLVHRPRPASISLTGSGLPFLPEMF